MSNLIKSIEEKIKKHQLKIDKELKAIEELEKSLIDKVLKKALKIEEGLKIIEEAKKRRICSHCRKCICGSSISWQSCKSGNGERLRTWK